LEPGSPSDTVEDEVKPILIAAFVFQLPSAGDAAQGALPAAQGPSELVEMFTKSGPVAMAVLALLLFASLYSWTAILGKIASFRKATSESRRFIRGFRKANRLQEISALASECKASPLAQVFEDVYETYKRQTGGSGPPRNLVPLERSAQTATIASVSPFVGLFGTVMGIVDAFHGLGTEGAATLRAVAPGISEALITTAAGLFVAIPALVAYNQFSARIRVFAAAIDDFCRELLNSLEESPVRTAGPQRTAIAEAVREPASDGGREVERGFYK
jgi:biopolymer transport protein TolQ